ncbi:oxygen-dependent protoporphyrinogen oxidase [Geomicrobium halophilum]|uniref:Coproporphyrinogen III oxidase n=1 Tax=Geomicrobium halophilum TaxID=549000 RepID=A0A841PYP8_9BACL|nr:protoporphyrinogen oxidase [Geomicrobium halophilum]MBB6449522.1 oxygen-dependent protoporphyrinogen oxidase [Geomicrobium halophilum]
MKVAIIGGGITGLSAFHELEKQRAVNGMNIEAELFEADSKLGGKIETLHREGFTIERGPDSFLARKPEMLSLAQELGLEDQLVKNETGKAFIVNNGDFHPIPEGSVMGIPTRVRPFLRSSLLSNSGKLRASADLWLPDKRTEGNDESLGLFFRKRFGDELVDRVLEPLLSGMYAGEMNELSLESTFPQFSYMGKKHRSLILGSRSMAKQRKQSAGTGQKSGLFRTFKGGLSVIVDELEKKAREGSIHKQKQLLELTPLENGYNLQFADGTNKEADRVILTMPHEITANVLPSFSAREEMKSLPGASIATVAIALKSSALADRIEGTGFLIPKGNDAVLKAVTLVHKKWPNMVPEGHALLRCFVGRPGNDDIVSKSDEEIVGQTLRDVRSFLEIREEPLFTNVTRWQNAMPKYTVGHQTRVADWESALSKEYPGVYIAGAFYKGIGLPDCVRQGQEVAVKALQ